jgi:DNA invertase Pin-like site-specific DNA recombinase
MNGAGMALVFYGRSSSATQESGLSAQIERAKALGIDEDHIFAELVSGKSKANRPKLAEMLRFVRTGDTLVVTKLDRLGRSAADLHAIAQQLQKKGVNLRVLDQSINTGTSAGRALFGMIAVFAEFERDLKRRVEGMRKYHARLKKEGRKPGPEKRIDPKRVRALRKEGRLIREIMQEVGASKASVYRALRDA